MGELEDMATNIKQQLRGKGFQGDVEVRFDAQREKKSPKRGWNPREIQEKSLIIHDKSMINPSSIDLNRGEFDVF